jgi:SAM-dependent methyltransferase
MNSSDVNRSIAGTYDRLYKTPHHFKYRNLMYVPFLSALATKAGLRKGMHILDAGCGQGYFTHLFATLGYRSTGVDISEEGIKFAKGLYSHPLLDFQVADILTPLSAGPFDAVFIRSCSLYNSHSFAYNNEVSRHLLNHLKSGGILIMDYHTSFAQRRSTPAWRHHTFADFKKHFSAFSEVQLYFTLRIAQRFLGAHAFSSVLTRVDMLVSKITGVGGELIAVARRN